MTANSTDRNICSFYALFRILIYKILLDFKNTYRKRDTSVLFGISFFREVTDSKEVSAWQENIRKSMSYSGRK